MKRAKLVFASHRKGNAPLLGSDVKLVDADTGEELLCCRDITIHATIDGAIIATPQIYISEVEVSDAVGQPPIVQKV